MSETKKIAILLPDLSGGGAERQRIHLANEWSERGYSVEIVLMRMRGQLLPLVSPKIKLIDLNVNRILHTIPALRTYLVQSKPDVILTAMWPLTSASVIAWLLSGRTGSLFLSDHNQLSISCVVELGISPVLVKAVIRSTYRFATGVIAVSHGVKEDLCCLGGKSISSANVIYNPAATGRTPGREPLEVQSRLWGDGVRYHILSVGSLKNQKDHETLIRAFAQLPFHDEAKLIILGDGPLRTQLQGLIYQLKLGERVSLPGFTLDPSPWYRTADLFVLSSRWEGFGNVIVEALEFGVPVVSTNCKSGPAEILDDGLYGKLTPIRDVGALAAAMTASLIETHDRDRLTNRAKDFSVRNISDQYLDLFFSSHL